MGTKPRIRSTYKKKSKFGPRKKEYITVPLDTGSLMLFEKFTTIFIRFEIWFR